MVFFKNTYSLYEFIDKNEGYSVIGLAKKMNWSKRKTEKHIKRLLEDGLIKTIGEPKFYFAKTVKELLSEWEI